MTDWSKFEWRDAREGDEGKPAFFEDYFGASAFGFLRGGNSRRWIDDGGQRWELCVVLAEKKEGK